MNSPTIHFHRLIICGEKLRAGLGRSENRFYDEAVVDALPVWRKPYEKLSDELFIFGVQVELDGLAAL